MTRAGKRRLITQNWLSYGNGRRTASRLQAINACLRIIHGICIGTCSIPCSCSCLERRFRFKDLPRPAQRDAWISEAPIAGKQRFQVKVEPRKTPAWVEQFWKSGKRRFRKPFKGTRNVVPACSFEMRTAGGGTSISFAPGRRECLGVDKHSLCTIHTCRCARPHMQPERTRLMDSGWRGTRNVVVVVCGTVACCLWTRAQPRERTMRDIEQRLVDSV